MRAMAPNADLRPFHSNARSVASAATRTVRAPWALAISVTRSAAAARSEEHTSELQSQSNLVCRLLLEKKNKRASRGPGAHQYAGDQPDRHDPQQRGQQLGDGHLRRADVARHAPSSASRPGPAQDSTRA